MSGNTLLLSGLAAVEWELQALERAAHATGTHVDVPLDALLSSRFLTKYTRFRSLQELCHASGLPDDVPHRVSCVVSEAWNRFVATCTPFSDWNHVLQVAAVEWAINKLELGEQHGSATTART